MFGKKKGVALSGGLVYVLAHKVFVINKNGCLDKIVLKFRLSSFMVALILTNREACLIYFRNGNFHGKNQSDTVFQTGKARS